jgi:hypothetical protein
MTHDVRITKEFNQLDQSLEMWINVNNEQMPTGLGFYQM